MQLHWSTSRVFMLTGILVVVATGGTVLVNALGPAQAQEPIGHHPDVSNPGHAADAKAIRESAAAYAKAFNAGDAKALAAHWTADGDLTDAEGRQYRGRQAIEKEFAAYFAAKPGLKVDLTIDSIRFPAGDVVIETGTARTHGAAGEPATTSQYTAVHVKKNGKWLLACVRESAPTSTTNYDRLRDLEWLVGNWTAKTGGVTIDQTCEWTCHRNFLKRTFAVKQGDAVTATGMQMIGWDPTVGQIRSWTFDCDGGFGSAVWSRQGNKWVQEATGISPNGSETDATNIITPVDHNSFTWRSVGRSTNEVSLPDTAEVKVVRVKAKK
jgi:uncharacterized protein (TIGR02246 family)